MPYDTRLNKLVTSQENQIKAFERKRLEVLEAVHQTEQELLQQHNCTYNNAPPDVLKIIAKLRDDYNTYWSNDGILINELMRRQTAARQRIIDTMKNIHNKS